MTKNIWFLSHYATTPNNGTKNRFFYLAKSFQSMGFKPYIFAANFHHYLNQEVNVEKSFLLDSSDDIPYVWLKTPRYSSNSFQRLFNIFYYVYAIARQANKIVDVIQPPDVIIVSSPHPFALPLAAKLAKKYNAKLFFEIRDLWPLTIIHSKSILRFTPVVPLMAWIEKYACKKADYVVSTLPNAFAYLKTKGLDIKRYAYIPNGFNTQMQRKIQSCPAALLAKITTLKEQNKFIIGYLGAHGDFNALDQLIDAFALLEKRGNHHIYVLLAGDGSEKVRLKEKAKDLKNIIFLDSISPTNAPHFLSLMDALFIGWRSISIYQYGISPDKIFGYMLAGKPIIHAVGTPHDSTQMAGCALVAPPENPPLLADLIENAAKLSPEELEKIGLKGKEYVLSNHDYDVLAIKYAELF